jgi:hypothetical protein
LLEEASQKRVEDTLAHGAQALVTVGSAAREELTPAVTKKIRYDLLMQWKEEDRLKRREDHQEKLVEKKDWEKAVMEHLPPKKWVKQIYVIRKGSCH